MSQPTSKYETAKTLLFAASIAILFRSLLFEPFHIPSGSMKNNLLVGDFIFVSKSSYGYSRYSFPLGINFFEGRVFASNKPKRGDVIVFRLPKSLGTDYIKRVIGMPGDTVQIKRGVVYLNGKEVPRKRMKNFTEPFLEGAKPIPRYRETLPNGVSYDVLDDLEDGPADNTGVYTVPEGHYFFLGDNRDHSTDSRFLGRVGHIPEENLVGRATVIAMSVKEDYSLLQVWRWMSAFRPGRFFKSLTPLQSEAR